MLFRDAPRLTTSGHDDRTFFYYNASKPDTSLRAPNFAQKAGNTFKEVTVRKSPLACPDKFGERGFRGVFEQAKNVDPSQLSHISPNLSLVAGNVAKRNEHSREVLAKNREFSTYHNISKRFWLETESPSGWEINRLPKSLRLLKKIGAFNLSTNSEKN